jgi:hypothetical protein
MNSPLLRRPSVSPRPQTERYRTLGLKDNPFPQRPTLVPTSPDPRLNGEIYCADLHSEKADAFRNLLIPNAEGRPVQTIAFLMDAASRRGRGIGKSAFLKHQQRGIMQDLGDKISDGAAVLFAAYIVPTSNPSCCKFWEFCRLLFESLNQQKIISIAIWRMRGLYGNLPKSVIDRVGGLEQWEDTIGSDRWLNEQQVNLWEANRLVRAKLIEVGLPDQIADDFVYHVCADAFEEFVG